MQHLHDAAIAATTLSGIFCGMALTRRMYRIAETAAYLFGVAGAAALAIGTAM